MRMISDASSPSFIPIHMHLIRLLPSHLSIKKKLWIFTFQEATLSVQGKKTTIGPMPPLQKKNAVQGLPSSRTLVLAPCHRCKPSGSTIRQHIHAQTHTYILKYIFSAPPLLHRYHHIATAENADLYHTDKIPYSSYNLLFNK